MAFGETARLNVLCTATDKASGVLSGITSRIGNLKTMMAGAGAAAALYFGKQMVDRFAQFDKAAQDSLAMFTDITDEQREIARKTSRDLAVQWAPWIENAEEAMDAYYWLGSAGIDFATSQSKVNDVIKFSVANTVSVEEASRLATTAMKTFGFQADELGYVMDRVTNTQRNSLVTMSDLIETYSYASGAASALNVEFDELNAMISMFADAGVAGAKAGTAIRRVMGNIVKDTGAASDMLRELGIETETGKGEFIGLEEYLFKVYHRLKDMGDVQRQEKLATLTGIRAWSGMAALIKKLNNPEYYPNLIDNIRKSGTVNEIAGEKADSAAGTWGRLSAKIDETKISIGNLAFDYALAVDDINDRTYNLAALFLPGGVLVMAISYLNRLPEELEKFMASWTLFCGSIYKKFLDYLVNPIIRGVNAVTDALNFIPGVSIENISPVKLEDIIPDWEQAKAKSIKILKEAGFGNGNGNGEGMSLGGQIATTLYAGGDLSQWLGDGNGMGWTNGMEGADNSVNINNSTINVQAENPEEFMNILRVRARSSTGAP